MALLDGIRGRSDAEAYKSVSSVPSSVSPTVEYMGGPLYLSWETVEASGRLPASLQCHIFVIRATRVDGPAASTFEGGITSRHVTGVLAARWPHQGGLEQNRGGQRAEQRQSHQLAHARYARLVGEP